MNMNEIAARLQITNGALTSHIRKLEEAGLIRVTQDSVGHGNQKVCSVLETRILVEIGTQEETGEGSIFRAEIPVGQYSDYQVFPTCGISTTKKMIGEVDDPPLFCPSGSRGSWNFMAFERLCGISGPEYPSGRTKDRRAYLHHGDFQ